jgi:hypothetical protein
MPRPFPWLPRLADIRRSVSNSVRSHYTRRDLELLLKVSPRAAGRVMELVATEPMGTYHLAARERLQSFLEAVHEADDVAALCNQLRAERENLTRVKARFMQFRDRHRVPLCSLPDSIVIEHGLLAIRADTVEELCARLVTLSQVMSDEPLEFQQAFETPRREEESAEARDARWIAEEIERMDTQLRHQRVIASERMVK